MQAAHDAGRLDWRGWMDHDALLVLMQRAEALIVPSRWYEGAPMTIVEAFACGLPVVASDLGAMKTMVQERRNGLRFTPGDAQELAAATMRIASNPGFRRALGKQARRTFEARYHADANYAHLLDLYTDAVRQRRASTASG